MEEREIRSVLHDGTEVVFNTGDRVLFQASRPGGMPLTIDADSLVDDLILTLEQRDATIRELQEAAGKPKIYLLSELHNERIKREQEHTKSEGLRKELEEAQAIIGVLPMDDVRLWGVYNRLCAALGEGDKQ